MKLPCTLIAAVLLAGCASPRPVASLAPAPAAATAPTVPADRPRTVAEATAWRKAGQPDYTGAIKQRIDTERAAAQAARNNFAAAHPKLSEADRKLLLAGGYALGWPADWVRASRGEPQRTSTGVSALGTLESWTYRSGHEIVYFLNGRVSRWHHSD